MTALLDVFSLRQGTRSENILHGSLNVTVAVKGRLILNDALTQLDTCLAGHGVAQLFDLGISHLLKSGELINLFPDWSDELFPLYLYHTSRRIAPIKLRTFIDFVVSSLKEQEDPDIRPLRP